MIFSNFNNIHYPTTIFIKNNNSNETIRISYVKMKFPYETFLYQRYCKFLLKNTSSRKHNYNKALNGLYRIMNMIYWKILNSLHSILTHDKN